MSDTKKLGLSDEHLRRMAEPDDLKELRRQADRIAADKEAAARNFLYEREKERLRRQISEAGETPCR